MQKNTEKLHNITRILLNPEDNYPELTKAIDALYSLFLSTSGLDADDDKNREDVYLAKGKAIGATWAAMCVKEILRTKYFIRGLYSAIKAAREKFPDTRIHILYAGTGPFATIAMPMTTVFTSEEISFTLLEINPESIRFLKSNIAAFQAKDYVNKIVQCDATTYQADKLNPIHIVLTETMQNALQKEPHVSIALNLVSQMLPEGILLPQNIKIDAVLMSPSRVMKRLADPCSGRQKYYHPLKTIFELNKSTFSACAVKNAPDGSCEFPEVIAELPSDIDSEYNDLNLLTYIQVFGDIELTDYQCSLNLPKRLISLKQSRIPSDKISFQYVISENPGFRYKFV
ncbi:Met-10+ like-protein [Ruminiclostridium sufflavum DSM 19573]|uniref:Met-10+ like-protein n=1 Tax=Ruminiclostridium sufflavum DSM 19573 TaxID=1121337 RepID=A0A318XPP8_9FIRM|nr:phytanoyl-CoA dioxygenase [Ruminiclostridium sufflavum]PYG89160.1 Met-10+ like-protein [Ruminiclostridium sufflavum DSM 19573]